MENVRWKDFTLLLFVWVAFLAVQIVKVTIVREDSTTVRNLICILSSKLKHLLKIYGHASPIANRFALYDPIFYVTSEYSHILRPHYFCCVLGKK